MPKRKEAKTDADAVARNSTTELTSLPIGLQLWNKIPSDRTFERSETIRIHPRTVIEPLDGSLCFQIDGTQSHCMDLSSMRLIARVKITREGGEALRVRETPSGPEYEDVSCVSSPLHAAFRSISVKLNGTSVGLSHDNYPVIGYISDATEYGKAAREASLVPFGLGDLDYGEARISSTRSKRGYNIGLNNRSVFFRESKVVELSSKINHDLIASADRLLMHSVSMELRFDRSDSRQVIMAPSDTDTKYQFHILSACIELRRLRLTQETKTRLDVNLIKAPASYPYTTIVPFTTEIPAGTSNIRIYPGWSRPPRRGLLCFVDSLAVIPGAYTKNCFCFEHGNIREISWLIDGSPVSAPIRTDFATGEYKEGYRSLLNALKKLDPQETPLNHDYALWGNSFPVFGCQFITDTDSMVPSKTMTGAVSVDIRFDPSKPTKNSMQCYLLGEYNSLCQIDANFTVTNEHAF